MVGGHFARVMNHGVGGIVLCYYIMSKSNDTL